MSFHKDDGPGIVMFLWGCFLRWRDWPPAQRWLYRQYIDPRRLPELEKLAIKELDFM